MGPSRNSFDTQAVQEQPLHRSCPRTAFTGDLSRYSLFTEAVRNSLYTRDVQEQSLSRSCPDTVMGAVQRQLLQGSYQGTASTQKLSSTFKIGQMKNSII
jgi:hypothetical protein